MVRPEIMQRARDLVLRRRSSALAFQRVPGPKVPGTPTSQNQPPYHLPRPAPVHGQANQIARRVQHLPEPALLLLPDRVAGHLLGVVLGLRHRVLQSS